VVVSPNLPPRDAARQNVAQDEKRDKQNQLQRWQLRDFVVQRQSANSSRMAIEGQAIITGGRPEEG
jgi:hypothetical protein